MDVVFFISLFFITLFQYCITLDRNDFYDYSAGTLLDMQVFQYITPIFYPHWSDMNNTDIDIVNSGVVRFSGLGGDNTLDVLTFATKLPRGGRIYTQHNMPSGNMKTKIMTDLNDINVNDFKPYHVIIATWIDVQFSAEQLYSTFQMVFTSNGNTTYAILLIEEISHDKEMTFYPEIDLRYAYEEGTKFIRSNFLSIQTGINSGTVGASTAAEENSNSGLAGRWIINLTADPRTINNTEKPPTLPLITAGEVQNSTGLSMKGKFKFTTLSLNGNVLTNSQGIDEISTILTKKEADVRYNELNEAIIEWVTEVYEGISGGDVKIKILDYRTGSLTFDYSVELTDYSKVCQTSSASEVCLPEIETEVLSEIGTSGDVSNDQLSGNIDISAVQLSDFDECAEETNVFCDTNAHCLDYPNQLKYGCVCKEGWVGDGFAGNCEKEKSEESSSSVLIIIVAVVLCVVITMGIAVFVYIFKRREKARELEEAFIKSGGKVTTGQQQQQQQKNRKSIFRRRTFRSTKRNVVHNEDFDLYHRT